VAGEADRRRVTKLGRMTSCSSSSAVETQCLTSVVGSSRSRSRRPARPSTTHSIVAPPRSTCAAPCRTICVSSLPDLPGDDDAWSGKLSGQRMCGPTVPIRRLSPRVPVSPRAQPGSLLHVVRPASCFRDDGPDADLSEGELMIRTL